MPHASCCQDLFLELGLELPGSVSFPGFLVAEKIAEPSEQPQHDATATRPT